MKLSPKPKSVSFNDVLKYIKTKPEIYIGFSDVEILGDLQNRSLVKQVAVSQDFDGNVNGVVTFDIKDKEVFIQNYATDSKFVTFKLAKLIYILHPEIKLDGTWTVCGIRTGKYFKRNCGRKFVIDKKFLKKIHFYG